ncbi:MAG: RNA polymerase sigma factor [Cyclobacteriaceae bacterium]|nr:RNA polymerase sigma factor [Cyclobacteriaceae bacterium]
MPISNFEHKLIQKCCDGNRTAYREFYEFYAGELLAIAFRYMKTKQEAEDVVQEAFIKAFKNLAAFDKQASLKTWLIRIVINTALNMLRKQHSSQLWNIDEFGDVELSVPSLDNYNYAELVSFIQQLPVGCRSVFNLYAIEGYSHKEVANLLSISQGTSKSQYHRAKILLQKMIASEETRTKSKIL